MSHKFSGAHCSAEVWSADLIQLLYNMENINDENIAHWEILNVGETF